MRTSSARLASAIAYVQNLRHKAKGPKARPRDCQCEKCQSIRAVCIAARERWCQKVNFTPKPRKAS